MKTAYEVNVAIDGKHAYHFTVDAHGLGYGESVRESHVDKVVSGLHMVYLGLGYEKGEFEITVQKVATSVSRGSYEPLVYEEIMKGAGQ